MAAINAILHWTGLILWVVILVILSLSIKKRFRQKLSELWDKLLIFTIFVNDIIEMVFFGVLLGLFGFGCFYLMSILIK